MIVLFQMLLLKIMQPIFDNHVRFFFLIKSKWTNFESNFRTSHDIYEIITVSLKGNNLKIYKRNDSSFYIKCRYLVNQYLLTIDIFYLS